MKWVVRILGVIAALIALMAVIGALLPEAHTATCTAEFSQSPAIIWNTITDFENAPQWRKELHRVEKLPEYNGRPAWKESSDFGEMPFWVVAMDSARRLETQIIDTGLEFGGSWTYVLKPMEEGTRLTITENGRVYNVFFRFLAKFVFGYHATLEDYLKSLGSKFGHTLTSGDISCS